LFKQSKANWPLQFDFNLQLNNLKQFYLNTDHKFINRFICSVCGTFNLVSSKHKHEYDYNILLRNDHHLKSSQLNDFSFHNDFIYETFPELNGLVLDRDGFIVENKKVKLCDNCHVKLKKIELPKYALANNLYVGPDIPELTQLTCIEESLIAKHHIKSSVIRINSKYKDRQYKMKGNIITYVKNPDNILELLPSLPNKENIQIAFVGKNYDKEKACSLLKVRRSLIENALIKLKSINKQYISVKISTDNLSKLPLDDIPQCLLATNIVINNSLI